MLGGLSFGVLGGLSFGVLGLLVGLLVGLLSELVEGIQTGLVDVRNEPNQGIQRSWRSARLGLLLGGLFGLLSGGLFGGLLFELGSLSVFGLVGRLLLGQVFGLGGGFLLCGGAAIIKHYLLRLLLPLSTPAPFNLVLWLEEARMCGLLVRVGGGYRFYHELLQRHFAAHEEPGYPRVPILAEAEQARTAAAIARTAKNGDSLE